MQHISSGRLYGSVERWCAEVWLRLQRGSLELGRGRVHKKLAMGTGRCVGAIQGLLFTGIICNQRRRFKGVFISIVGIFFGLEKVKLEGISMVGRLIDFDNNMG